MGELTIRVKTLDGQTNEVKLEDTSTVLQLKEIVEQKTQIATNRQKIIYRGRVLTDNLLLKDQADINGSAVHVVDSNRVMNSVARASQGTQSGSGSSGRTRKGMTGWNSRRGEEGGWSLAEEGGRNEDGGRQAGGGGRKEGGRREEGGRRREEGGKEDGTGRRKEEGGCWMEAGGGRRSQNEI